MKSTAASHTVEAPSNPPSGVLAREGLTILIFSIAVTLVVMNTAMFNMALPDVTSDFAISAATASWIVTGYSIMFAVSSITFSRLSDFVPLRRLLMIGLLALGGAGIVGFFSQSFIVLLLCRIVQASGAGGAVSLAMVLFTRYIPLERRGSAMATIMSAVALGLGLGPVVGGVIVENLSWRWLFAVTAAVLLLLPLFARLLPKELPRRGSFDAIGGVLLAVGITSLLLFLTNQIWVLLALGLVSLVLFILRIRLTPDPFVLPSLFANKRYLLLALAGMTAYICNFSTLFLLPQILTRQFSFTVGHAGLIIFPGSLLAIVASRRIGKVIDRYGNHGILRYGPPLLLVSTLLFALLIGQSWIAAMLTYMVLSISFTALSSSLSNEMSRVLPESFIGSGMGLFQLLQFFSGAFSVAMATTALEWQHTLPLANAYSNIYWGLSASALIAIVSAIGYRRHSSRLSTGNEVI
ncbi:MFS transporter [Saccharibacillus sp. CPCC 101409]|uniref:MFS transporter n=1 Tax=Saccharibacillus sp. CPCC 101409 TaxID=3058041 RepID=UPI002671430B|nr:MFS transporter [Saccharibacillus sp. CPCC 101409]MDO3412433.1 MFS transporter [Saccharibacillus sp. CPCC 101409]